MAVPVLVTPLLIGLFFPRKFLAVGILISSIVSVSSAAGIAFCIEMFSYHQALWHSRFLLVIPIYFGLDWAFLAAITYLLAHLSSCLGLYVPSLGRTQTVLGRLDDIVLLGYLFAIQFLTFLPALVFYSVLEVLCVMESGLMRLTAFEPSHAFVFLPLHPRILFVCNLLTPIGTALILRWAYKKGRSGSEKERPSASKNWLYCGIAVAVLLLTGWLKHRIWSTPGVLEKIAPAVSSPL